MAAVVAGNLIRSLGRSFASGRGKHFNRLSMCRPHPHNIIQKRVRGFVSGVGSSCDPNAEEFLRSQYEASKAVMDGKTLPKDVNPSEVFVSNELDLREINVYGFDYDYTIAQYDVSVEELIYELGKQKLIGHYKYPQGLRNLEYNRNYAVRGLHYDIEHGHIMKLDQFQQIQSGSIYRGLTQLTDEEVLKAYGARALALDYVEGHLHGKNPPSYIDGHKTMRSTPRMAHLADLFSMPEMCLLRQVAQYFMDNNLPYHSVSIFNDVKGAIGSIHPEMHRIVSENIEKYIVRDENLVKYMRHLKEKEKQTFIITNSPFALVEKGLEFLFGEDWQDLFDVVIALAKKPAFFVDKIRPFRRLEKTLHMKSWETVSELKKGTVYLEGNLASLQQLQQWNPQEILYFGDHPYSDLADLTLHHLWRTGAIIWELDYEIKCLNTEKYKRSLGWLQMLQRLIEKYQNYRGDGAEEVVLEWIAERDQLREDAKIIFNEHFGSVFRTHDNPTYFSRRLFRFADIYTAQLSNLANYSTRHVFYPRKGVLPHEYKSLFV